jgi:hypothetical protein
MRYIKAVDPLDGTGGVHAVEILSKTTTLCRLSAESFVLREEDWEDGSHRLSCAVCVDLVASFHREWSTTRGAKRPPQRSSP